MTGYLLYVFLTNHWADVINLSGCVDRNSDVEKGVHEIVASSDSQGVAY